MAKRTKDRYKDTLDIGMFPKGVDNISPETNIPNGFLRSAKNVDITKEGNVNRRDGYTKIYSGNNIHSLYENYFVEGSELKEIIDEISPPETIAVGISLNRYLAWETVLSDYYYSDGNINRIVGKGPWGIPTPPNNPNLSEVTGVLNAGTYQVTICFQNPVTGELGGALLASKITVNESAGILLNDIPVSPDGYNTIVYVSTQNGKLLYQNTIVPNGLTTFTIINSRESTKTLSTQFMEPLPGGHIIRLFKARLYVARDNVLWFSEAFRYGLHNPDKDFFQFPSRITIVQAVDDGIFVVADKTYFLPGTEPKNVMQRVVSDDQGIEGTGVTMQGESFGNAENPLTDQIVGYWFSQEGAVLGLPGGQIMDLTDENVAINENLKEGVSFYRKRDGIKQMITVLPDSGNSSGFRFGAEATSQIIRNGVVIP
jgi:hypothetical protein